MSTKTVIQRLYEKIDTTAGPNACHPWTGYVGPEGYGMINVNYSPRHAGIYLYRELRGPIPKGYTLDHTCHTDDLDCLGGKTDPHRSCVNIAHLELVSRAENTRRGRSYLKGRCPNGHLITSDANVIFADGRYCNRCFYLAA